MKVRKIKANSERQLIIAMIMSTSFIKKIHPIINFNYFETKATSTIAYWIIEYFEKYNKAPKAMIQDIYKENKSMLAKDDKEWISDFLTNLSKEYEKAGFNEEYVFENSLKFFKKQKMKKGIIKIEKLLDKGKIEEAEKIWIENRTIPALYDLGFNPFDTEWVDEVLRREKERTKATLGFGALDEIIGPIKSGWFVLFMGPQKRGKTWSLIWAAIDLVMQGLDVNFYSFEGEDEDWTFRAWAMITSFVMDEESKELEFPEFLDDKGEEIKYKKKKRPSMTSINMKQAITKFNKFAKGRLTVKSFGMGTNMSEAEQHNEMLSSYKNINAHATIFDYVGIVNKQIKDRQERYNETGMQMKAWAKEKKQIFISGHQGKRETLEKLNMNPNDMPEDIRLLGHVDVLIGINQTDEERKAGIMRYSALIHRHKKYLSTLQAKVLQQLEAGQVVLDSRKIDAPELTNNFDSEDYTSDNNNNNDDDFNYA